MIRIYLFLVFLLTYGPAHGQPYIEGRDTRHRFAQLNIGVDGRSFLSNGSQTFFRNAGGGLTKRSLRNQMETRLIIGGTHFWGHADFYVAFPFASWGGSGFGTSVETGAKVFPWRIENKKIRPFIGVAWLPNQYQQEKGAEQVRHGFPLLMGLVLNYGNQLFEIQAGYNFKNSREYYINVNDKVAVETQPLWLGVGYKLMIETTLGAERNWQSGKTKSRTDTLAKAGKLNGLTLAIGPSSAIFLKSSRHNEVQLPFIDHHKLSNVFPEVGMGYYWYQPDIQVNLAYRRIKSEIQAYGHTQGAYRNALSLEAYKFLGDYHGFAPFIGGALSQEWLKVVEERPGNRIETARSADITAGVVFGWDIRPDDLQSWYLRTNLRWFPALDVDMSSGDSVSMDQLEFNFIQLVLFPGRMF